MQAADRLETKRPVQCLTGGLVVGILCDNVSMAVVLGQSDEFAQNRPTDALADGIRGDIDGILDGMTIGAP